jgi:DNA-binding MarR family transcriptional regulator
MGDRPGKARGRPQPLIRVGEAQEREWPGSSALATACVLNLANVAIRVMAYGLERVRAEGIPSVAAFNVLTILDGEGGPLSPSTIADRMILTRGTVTGVLDTLERRGLIRRTRHEADGRMRQVTITARGSATVAALLPVLHRAERAWMDALTVAQQRELLGLLAIIQARAPA